MTYFGLCLAGFNEYQIQSGLQLTNIQICIWLLNA